MRRRVLFILHLPEPLHGAAMVGQAIKQSIKINCSFETDYINLSTSRSLANLRKGGIRKIFTFLKIQYKVLNALLKNEYDLVYLTLTAKGAGFYKDFLVVCLLKLFRRKILYHLHNKGISERQENTLDHILYRIAFHRSKAILLSPRLFYDISKYLNREDVFICANGVASPNSLIKQVADNYTTHHCCKILFLSNMVLDKGIFILLDACQILAERRIPFECHYVGDWADISEFEFNHAVQRRNLSKHVVAHGKRQGKEKTFLLANSDVFVLPTYYKNECFPLVLLEAMEAGLPVISTPEGGIPDMVIDNKTGFLVEQQNSKALAERIELLIKNPRMRIQMGKAGRERYESLYTINNFEGKFINIINKAINL